VDVKRDYVRDGDGQFSRVAGAAQSVDNAADKLGLASRIHLELGERLVSSSRLPTSPNSDRTGVAAVISDSNGRHVRIGFVAAGDERRWAGANRGGTVRLDAAGTTRLDAALVDLTGTADAWGESTREFLDEFEDVATRRRQLQGRRDRAGRSVRTEAEDAELEHLTTRAAELGERMDAYEGDAVIASGVIPGGDWGDIAYEVAGNDDSEGGWELQLAVRPPDAEPSWTIYDATAEARFLPAQIRILRQRLAAAREQPKAAHTIAVTSEGSGRMQVKNFRGEIKSLEDEGTVRFVVATLNEVDKDGDVTLSGFFGKQHTVMVPVHDWNHVPIGKGVIFEEGNEAIAEMKLNLDIPAARDWHSALKFDFNNPPALQEYSYGYTVLDGGSEYGDFKGRRVRFLKGRPDGTPGVTVHETSTVLLGAGNGTRTLGVKNAPQRFADEGQAVVAAVRALSDRAADVMAKRLEKGKGLGADSVALLEQVEAELKRLSGLLTAPTPADPEPDELMRIYLRQIARNHR
jgi:hypothetical protein